MVACIASQVRASSPVICTASPIGGGIAEEAHEAHGEVARMRQRPEGLAVAVHDHPPPVEHPLGHGEVRGAEGGGHPSRAIGVRGPDDSVGEARRSRLLLERPLALDLVPRIIPIWIREGRRLRDHVMHGRLAVGRGRADEYELGASGRGKGGCPPRYGRGYRRRSRPPRRSARRLRTRATAASSRTSAPSDATPAGRPSGWLPLLRCQTSMPFARARSVQSRERLPVPPMNNTFMLPPEWRKSGFRRPALALEEQGEAGGAVLEALRAPRRPAHRLPRLSRARPRRPWWPSRP